VTPPLAWRRSLAVVAALSCLGVIGSCSTHPGYAATVGDDQISEEQVDDVAQALCDTQAASGQGQELATRSARQVALGVLVESSLSRQFGESEGVEPDPEQLSAAVASREEVVATLPASIQDEFRTTLEDFAAGQLILADIGGKSLTAQGTASPTQEEAVAEGTRLRGEWAADNAEVDVDPRFGTFTDGALVSESGSLSEPVSDEAKDGADPEPSEAFVASLPASQKCS
jgi:SurA N-terminal domain